VLIRPPEGGLRTESVALLNQIRSIDKQRLVRRLGSLPPRTIERVERAILVSLGLVKI
jgi:mRNA interferase MazF